MEKPGLSGCGLAAPLAVLAFWPMAMPALAQTTPPPANYTRLPLYDPNSLISTVTGIRGDNMTGDYSTGVGANTAGLLYRFSTATFTPFNLNIPGVTSETPYGPSVGSVNGILRVVGSYQTAASAPYDLSFLYDGAAAPGAQPRTLVYPSSPVPGAPQTLFTIAHSNFGNTVVGDYDTSLATGNAFIYDIPTNIYTTNNKPGALSTTAYGVWGNVIAGGFATPSPIPGGPTFEQGYIYNRSTNVWTAYDAPLAPGAVSLGTHFEGITGGGRAGEYNLVADSVDSNGIHAWAVHVDANGVATWTEIAVPNEILTSANSVYGDTVIGVYTDPADGKVKSYYVTVPNFYNPITNATTLSTTTPNTPAMSGGQGDDLLNTGTIKTSGSNSAGISSDTYGVVTNRGTISVTGAGSAGVLMNGTFGTLLNAGTITAAPGGYAIATGPTASGSIVVNGGVIDGQVAMAAGPDARFENSGWLGISAAGSGTTHTISGTFVQTSAGTLSLRVGPNGSADSLQVTGVARLAGTAQTVFQPGILSTHYTLLRATGGLSGTFDSLMTQNKPSFLTASLTYSATDVLLSLQSTMSSTPGLNGNQTAVSHVLDANFNSGAGLAAMPGVLTLTTAQLPQALSVLSGDSTSVTQTAALTTGGLFASMLTERAATRRADELACVGGDAFAADACAPPPDWSAWASGFGATQWLKPNTTTGNASAQQTIGGGAAGGDYRVAPDTLIGFAIGISESNFSVPDRSASGWATGGHLGVYALQNLGDFYVNGALSYSHAGNNTTRVIAGIGTTEIAKGSFNSDQLGARVEVGRPYAFGAFGVTPFGAFAPRQLWQPNYTETSTTVNGAPGVFALAYQSQSVTSLPLSFGAQFDAKGDVGSRPFSSFLRLAWLHEFNPDRLVTAGFTTLPGSIFTVNGAADASNALRVDLGAKYTVSPQTSLFANLSAQISDRSETYSGLAGLKIVW